MSKATAKTKRNLKKELEGHPFIAGCSSCESGDIVANHTEVPIYYDHACRLSFLAGIMASNCEILSLCDPCKEILLRSIAKVKEFEARRRTSVSSTKEH